MKAGQSLVVKGKSLWDIFKAMDPLSQVFEITVLAFITHTPKADEGTTPVHERYITKGRTHASTCTSTTVHDTCSSTEDNVPCSVASV